MSDQARQIPRPNATEYDPYYETYVSKVGPGPILTILEEQQRELQRRLTAPSEEQADYRYAPDKWSLKEVIGHLVDTERVFAYRALCFARSEQQPLPGMDQDNFVAAGNFGRRRLDDLAHEALAVRKSTLLLFKGASDEQLGRTGAASGCTFTTRSIAYIIAGHERHHVEVLERRYGLSPLS